MLYFWLTVLALICVLPMWHVIMGAFSNYSDIYVNNSFLFVPIGKFSPEAWKYVFEQYPIGRGYLNTIFYTLASTLIGLLLSLLGGYVLSRKNFMFRVPLFIIILLPMFINAGIMPLYIVVYNLHMTNTVWAVILPTCCNAMNIFMVRAGMEGISDSYAEAAQLDGAGHLRILFSIIVPLVVPYISVVVMFAIIAQWNSWMYPKIFLSKQSEDLYPLALIVRNIILESESNNIQTSLNEMEEYGPIFNLITILISSVPLLITYPFIQGFFEKAVVIGGVKG